MADAYVPNAYWGMGDNVWQIPYLRRLSELYDRVFIMTPWPRMYHALPKVVPLDPRDDGSSRAGWDVFRGNIEANSSLFVRKRDVAKELEKADLWPWGAENMNKKTDLEKVCQKLELGRVDLSFPIKPEWQGEAEEWLDRNVGKRPRILLHPPVNHPGIIYARDPVPRYFKLIHDEFRKDASFFDAAWHESGKLEPVIELPIPVFQSRGLNVTTFWAVAALADAIVCSPNQMLMLALAFRKPTLVIWGGCWWPNLIVDPRVQHGSYVSVEPNPFCGCGLVNHDCAKVIDERMILKGFRSVLAYARKSYSVPPASIERETRSSRRSSS